MMMSNILEDVRNLVFNIQTMSILAFREISRPLLYIQMFWMWGSKKTSKKESCLEFRPIALAQ